MPSLLAIFGIDATKFKVGLDKAVDEAAKKGPSLEKALFGKLKESTIFNWIASPIGAASTAAVGFIGGIIAKTEELRDRAKEIKFGTAETNLTAQQYQPLLYAAQGAGANPEAIAKG